MNWKLPLRKEHCTEECTMVIFNRRWSCPELRNRLHVYENRQPARKLCNYYFTSYRGTWKYQKCNLKNIIVVIPNPKSNSKSVRIYFRTILISLINIMSLVWTIVQQFFHQSTMSYILNTALYVNLFDEFELFFLLFEILKKSYKIISIRNYLVYL